MATDLDYVPGNTCIPEGAFGISPSRLSTFFNKIHEWYYTELLAEKKFDGSTSSYLGTIVHFIAEEYTKKREVDKPQIYKYLYEQLVTEADKARYPAPDFTVEEEAEDYLCEHTDPEHVDVQYIFNNYRPMGNALISYLRTRARPGRIEELISAEVLPGYYVCGSCDAVMGNSKVIDYKTTSALNAPTSIPYEYKLQLLCYAYIYKKMGLPINAISIIWITHNQVNRISETTGKPMKDYPTTVTDTTEYVGDEDFAFIESLLKLVSETVQASIDYPQLKHVIFKDYRLK